MKPMTVGPGSNVYLSTVMLPESYTFRHSDFDNIIDVKPLTN